MTSRKLIALMLIYAHVLFGCVANDAQYGAVRVGPKPASSHEDKEAAAAAAGPKLEVIIPVFDPGLSESEENYDEEGVWPELRKAEANRFAVKLKNALDDTRAFGAVRVTPDETASGDLYVLGKIDESNGWQVGMTLTTIDATGKTWMKESFDHEVSGGFYKDLRKKGQDAYDPLFTEAAQRIVELLRKRSAEELGELQYLANLRFAAHFSEDAFAQHMRIRNGKVTLISKPSDDDPMLKRTNAIRLREQIFVDGMQHNYLAFHDKMNDSYLKWQEASFQEQELRAEAKKKAAWQAVGGALLLGLSVAAAVASGNSPEHSGVLQAGAVAGGLATAWMFSKSFQSVEEAKLHQDTLNELGESVNLEFAPRVIEFENQTVQLTGNAQEQFTQWRAFLQEIYEREATPDVML